MKKDEKRKPFDILKDLQNLPGHIDARLQSQMRRSLNFGQGPMRPADVSRYLQQAMLDPENTLEDAQYRKIVPNRYVVELNEQTYKTHFQPIGSVVCTQWQDKLEQVLETKNSRLGRDEYRFAGPVQVEIETVTDVAENEVRIQSQIIAPADVIPEPEPPPPPPPSAPVPTTTACLELLPGEQQWQLSRDVTLIGRNSTCDIHFDYSFVKQKRLISGQHAYIRYQDGRYRLYDGAPDGSPSSNGTFINDRRVSPKGHVLQAGDVIILAAVDPSNPRPDTLGVVTLFFNTDCRP
ncbi:MAG: DUF3662 domain-containing protein [Anaerolineae bacterium]|nr:DUF3662 domain-containing protein [Anaerolineae bacterium]